MCLLLDQLNVKIRSDFQLIRRITVKIKSLC